MRTAAQDALDYLAATFAFQSLEMKRTGPFRRSMHNMRRPGIYENDGVVFAFGVLAGGHSSVEIALLGNYVSPYRQSL